MHDVRVGVDAVVVDEDLVGFRSLLDRCHELLSVLWVHERRIIIADVWLLVEYLAR